MGKRDGPPLCQGLAGALSTAGPYPGQPPLERNVKWMDRWSGAKQYSPHKIVAGAKQKITISDDKSPDQTAISKFGVSDIMEILKHSKVKTCKDSMECDQNNIWKQ